MKVTVHRKAHFNAAHRLYRKDWSFEKNDEVFGLCNNPNFHGHNYELIASVTGDIDPETGYVIDVKILKEQNDDIMMTIDLSIDNIINNDKEAIKRTKDPEKKANLTAAYKIWTDHLEKLKKKTKEMNK